MELGKEVGRSQGMVFLAKETTSTKALRTTEVKGLPKVSTLLAFRQPAADLVLVCCCFHKLCPGPSGKERGQDCADQCQPSVRMGTAGAQHVDQLKQPGTPWLLRVLDGKAQNVWSSNLDWVASGRSG